MEKIKNIFRPGHEQDDNVMYGTPEPKNTHALGGSHDHEDAMAANPGVDKSDQGDLRATPNRSEPTTQSTSTTQPSSSAQYASGTQSGYATQTGSSTEHDQTGGLTGSSAQRDQPGGVTGTAGGVTGQILNPHNHKYDESRFPSGTSAADPESQATYTQQLANEQLRTDPGVEKRNHGILRQILNPDGQKFDETAFGTTAHTQSSVPGHVLQTDPEKEKQAQGGVMRQLLNPNSSKYDEQAYGTTASTNHATTAERAPAAASAIPRTSKIETDPEAEKASQGGVLRQIVNPGGGRFDETGYGQTATVSGPTSTAAASGAPGTALERLHSDNSSTMAIKGGKAGPYARDADQTVPGSSTTGDDSHLGRDAALGTAGAAGLGAAGYEANKHYNDPSRATTSQTQTTGPTSTTTTSNERHFPLSGGATSSSTAPASSNVPGTQQLPDRTAKGSVGNDSHFGRDAAIGGTAAAGAAGAGLYADQHNSDPYRNTGHQAQPASTHASSAASGDQGLSSTTGDNSHLGRDAAIAGGVVGAGAGAGALAHEHRTHGPHGTDDISAGRGTNALGDRRRDPAVDNATYTARSFHLPGDSSGFHHDNEKPHEGYVHHVQGPHASDIANRLDPHVPGEYPNESGTDRHLGRDAAIGGAGLGAAGIGAHELSQRDQPSTASSLPTGQSTGPGGIGSYEMAQGGDSRLHPVSEQQTPGTSSVAPQSQHHYGRDAALAGGAGAAGVGAYELSKDHRDPTSQTAGTLGGQQPSSATGAYGLPDNSTHDPSYVPLSSSQAQSGPAATGVASSTHPPGQEHRYGRDAAVAGGAGAAGVGAYELGKGHESRAQAPQGYSQQDPMSTTTNTTTTTTTSTGPHSSNLANKADPRVQSGATTSDGQRAAQPQQASHAGRETAIAGGAGAAGVGAYEAEKHHHGDGHNKLHKKDDPRGWTQEEKHERELQQARQHEAATHGDKGEKKESLIHRILHPGQHKHEKETTPDRGRDTAGSTATGATAAGGSGIGGPEYGSGQHVAGQAPQQLDGEGRVIDPHTGLPMNVAKYGDGAGGTDGAATVHGYHGHTGQTGTDWADVKKANTPY